MTNKQQDPVLPIEIYEVTSSDPQYPAQQVLQGNPLAPGWRSAANAAMPQSLTVRVQAGTSAISSIQFVAHETFTPALVEVHVAAEEPPASWLRLGHVRVGENTSGTRARERKTFRYKTNAKLVKFTVAQLLGNVENITHQAGLCSVVIRGVPLEIPEVQVPVVQGPQTAFGATANRPPSAFRSQDVTAIIQAQGAQNQQQYNYPSQPAPMEPKSAHVAKADAIKTEIQLLKTKAVEAADYLGAERYKIAHRKLSELQNTLEQLELRKTVAIQKEDFVTANTMKEAILQIEQIIDTPELPTLVALLNGEKPQKAPEAQPKQVKQVTLVNNEVSAPVAQQSASEPQNQTEDDLYKGDNLADAVPVIRTEEQTNGNPDDRALNVKAQGGGKAAFELTEEEKAQLAAEARARALAFQKKKEREIKRRNGIEEDDDEPVVASAAPGTVGAAPTFSGADLGPAWPIKPVNFDFQTEIQRTTTQFEGEGGPGELGPQVDHGPEASVLRATGLTEICVRLLASKQLEHCQAIIMLLEAALRDDPAGRAAAAQAALTLLGQNVNAALLGYGAKLFYFTYLGICAKYVPALANTVAVDFRDIPGVDPAQEGVQLAEMTVQFKNGNVLDLNTLIQSGIGKQVNIFAQEVLTLIAPLISRLSAQQKRTRTTAINILTTLAGFPGFPIQQFFNAVGKKLNIDRYSGLRPEDQKLTNQKYMAIVESRVSSLAIILKPNYDLAAPCQSLLLELIEWVLPHATKADLKRSILDLAVLLYEGLETPNQLIEIISKAASKAPAVLKSVQTRFEQSDASRGVEPRTKYVERDGQGRLLYVASSDNIMEASNDGFRQHQCQFCLFEAASSGALREHLLRDCRCCAVCPACHLIVEVPVLPEHLVTECTGRQAYAYKLAQCPKCQSVYEENALQEHIRQCQVRLTGDACICPLCNAPLADTEAALDHYAEGKCEANPRANAKLRALIDQKLAAKG